MDRGLNPRDVDLADALVFMEHLTDGGTPQTNGTQR